MPPGIKFEQKVPPKKRVIATKLNLRQKCVFHLFYRFSFPFIIFLCFPSFFIVFFSTFFIVLLCFSSFLIIPNLFPFRTETVTSDHFSWNLDYLQHKTLYVQPLFLACSLKTLPFSFFSYQNIEGCCKWNLRAAN